MFGSGMITLIISSEEMNVIMKIVTSLEESGLLMKGVSEVIQNEAKEQKGGLSSMLLGALGASSLGNLLIGKGVKKSKIPGQGVMRAGEVRFNAGQDFNAASSFN